MGTIVELTDLEWAVVDDLFDPAGRRGKPALYPRRRMVEAILFLARTGCQWRYLPDQAVTLTTSTFQGTILAGTDITLTGTSLAGRALATGAVTMTDSHIVGCTGTGKVVKQHCNQGVGNGPEGCDPGNSNQGNPARSNDELGGTPGHPGRQGGNHDANTQAKGTSTLHGNAKIR